MNLERDNWPKSLSKATGREDGGTIEGTTLQCKKLHTNHHRPPSKNYQLLLQQSSSPGRQCRELTML